MTDTEYTGTFREFTHQALSAGSWGPLRMTENESTAVAQVEDEGFELARAGKRFMGGCGVIANGIAPDTAIPTTTAKLVLYNSNAAGGASIFLNRFSWTLGSGTPTAGAALFFGLATAVIATPPTMATGYGAVSVSGNATVPGGLWGTAVTMPASTKWTHVTSQFQLAAANVGQGDGYVETKGGILIRPGHGLGIAILSGTGTTPLYSVGAFWTEIASTIV